MGAKYVDTSAIIQVIGGVFLNSSLLDDKDKYYFHEEDFIEEFHKVLFESIYNLHALGAQTINANTIEDYLSQRPKALSVYKINKGAEYLDNLSRNVVVSTFDYYYQRMKKMTLMRMYHEKAGMDLSWLYDPDILFDVKKKQAQEDWLDNTSLIDIANIINDKIEDVKLTFVNNCEDTSVAAGEGIRELIQSLQETPEYGYPLFGPLVTTITRGARLKKFYLRSAATGVGKTRSMIADACYISCDEIYDSHSHQWIKNGTKEPTIFIATEQDLNEIQTMMLAFLSDVNEEHIVTGHYDEGELDRVYYAADLISRCPLYVQQLPDFSLQDIENVIKRGIKDHDVKYVFLDYIHSSMKILSEITSKTGVKGLREDNILFMMSIRLKDLCNQYGVFVMSATQLNADYTTAKQYDQNLLRGAKAIADKIDLGMIMLETDADDIAALEKVLLDGGFENPTVKISVYKNRRGKYKGILLWCKSNRGTCKIEPMFVTNYKYELVPIEDIQINIEEPEHKWS